MKGSKRNKDSEVDSSIAGGRSTPGSNEFEMSPDMVFDDKESVSDRMYALDNSKKPQEFYRLTEDISGIDHENEQESK